VTTETRQLPPHGTEYRYRGPMDGSWPGCRCAKCTHAQHRGGKVRRLQHLRGEGPLHPGAPVAEHIKVLHDSGMSYALIARRADVSDATVTYLVRGITKNPKRDKALRILAVQPAEFDKVARRPAFRSIRRVRALYFIGHNPTVIAAKASLDPATISAIANDRYETVEGFTEDGIRKAYAQLITVIGTSSKAKKRAADLGWHGPLDWDDIDDPAAKPEAGRKPRARTGSKVYADPARVAELTAAGRTAQQIADQLGCHKRTVVRIRSRVAGDMQQAA
jgi:DNA-binding CsgD family transcriptional regulator